MVAVLKTRYGPIANRPQAASLHHTESQKAFEEGVVWH
jgi:hypothetical protein